MNEIYKWLSYKKNRTKFVHVTCFAIGVAILLGLFGDGLHPKIGWMSDDKPVNELCSYLSHTFSEMQAEPRQIRGDHFEVFEAADRVDSDREESLRIGRCAEHILRGNPALISVFVLGNMDEKCKRIMDKYNLSHDEALRLMKRKDATRKSYHNYYCSGKWGDSRNYDLCINSSNLGVDGVVDIIELLVKRELSSREALL